jgi:CDP-paratose 2-epimerase
MKYLITGGCGFIGSNLASEVIKRKEELIVLDNLFRTGSEKNLEWLKTLGNFEFYNRDIRNYNDVENVVKKHKPDIIFHLAGQVAMTTSIEDPRLDFEVNALGTHNLLEAVRKYSNESIILYSSTNKVYGDFETLIFKEEKTRYISEQYPNGFDEKMPLDFHSPYGCSKGAADQYLLDYYRIFGIKTVVFRHSSMFGGRQFSTYDQGWIGWFCKKAIEIKNNEIESFTINGNGKQVRDVLYADDVVDLYFKTIDNIDKTKGNVYNIGGGMENSLSLLELFEILENELNIKMKYEKLPWRESDQKIFVADTTKIKKDTNWSPRIDKLQGIRKMLEWIEE